MRNFTKFVVLGMAAASLAACSSGDAKDAQSDAPRIVLVMSTSKSQGDYAPANYKAAKKMADDVGANLQVAENSTYDEAPQALRRYGREGYDVVIAESSAYADAVLEVAPDFPDTWFVVVSDLPSTKDLPNVAAWRVPWAQMGYMDAVVACAASKTKKIGMVTSLPIPAFESWQGGGKLGAKAECGSTNSMLTVSTNSLSDVAKARSAALAMHSDGADVVFDSADTAGAGIFQAAQEGGFLTIGKYVDESSKSPDTAITSLVIDFDSAYEELGKLYTEDKLEPKIYPVNFSLVKPFAHVEDEVQTHAAETLKKLQSGEIQVPVNGKS